VSTESIVGKYNARLDSGKQKTYALHNPFCHSNQPIGKKDLALQARTTYFAAQSALNDGNKTSNVKSETCSFLV